MYIFVSYSKEGLNYASIVKNKLAGKQHITFLSHDESYGGSEAWTQISEALYNARVVIFVVTESSQTSDGQTAEFNATMNNAKPYIPFIKDGIVLKQFYIMTARNHIKFNDSNISDKTDELTSSIERMNISEGDAMAVKLSNGDN
ncbi:MAG: toll/interleukin-1 receptor domain-containing protein [Candidatus Aenigmatarchaeota archaeon]|nr:MAG: toll/interleukin-1 receptor domain-containing protein [Candidatus Aenigmarchaeota archaeon]